LRVIETQTNYQSIIQAITLFDNVISDNIWNEKSRSFLNKSRLILEHLLYGCHENKFNFDPFIYKTFEVFIRNKKQIKINMKDLDYCIKDKVFLQVIFGSNVFVSKEKAEAAGRDYFIPVNNENLFDNKFLQRLNKVTSMEISGVQTKHTNKYWSFSLINLLSLIEDTKIENIKISTTYLKKGANSWLSYLFDTSFVSLIGTYKNKGFDIKFSVNEYGEYCEHCIDIDIDKKPE